MSAERDQRYGLKAACSHCGRYGMVDDITMICRSCGREHEPTSEQIQQRDADLAVWSSVMAARPWWRRF